MLGRHDLCMTYNLTPQCTNSRWMEILKLYIFGLGAAIRQSAAIQGATLPYDIIVETDGEKSLDWFKVLICQRLILPAEPLSPPGGNDFRRKIINKDYLIPHQKLSKSVSYHRVHFTLWSVKLLQNMTAGTSRNYILCLFCSRLKTRACFQIPKAC